MAKAFWRRSAEGLQQEAFGIDGSIRDPKAGFRRSEARDQESSDYRQSCLRQSHLGKARQEQEHQTRN
jgi:hypothetical protein